MLHFSFPSHFPHAESHSYMCNLLKVPLHDAISLGTHIATLKIEIHCKLQGTCSALQSQAAICNPFENTCAIIASHRIILSYIQFICSNSFQICFNGSDSND